MKRLLFIIFSLVCITGCQTGPNIDLEKVEALDREGHRIVSTTVALTEMMDALDLDLIGKPSSYKNLPERYEEVMEVGNPMSPDMELILALQPKQLLSVTTLQYDLEPLFEKNGMEAYYADLKSVEDMLKEIETFGKMYGREQEAANIVAPFYTMIEEMERKTASLEKPRVLILMGVPGSYLVATEHSYIGNLVKLAGGENVIKGEDVEYVASNTEYLQHAEPDIILRAAHGMPDEVVEMFDREFQENDIWKHFKAVQDGRVYDLEERIFGMTASLAAEEALHTLHAMLYESEGRR